MADIKRLGMVFDDTLAYLQVVALPGCKEFMELHDSEQAGNPGLYIRRFVTAAESLNNALDYFYWDANPNGTMQGVNAFRKNATVEPALSALSNIANAYKHAVRASNAALIPRATELIKPPSVSELMSLHKTPSALSRRSSQWIDPKFVADLKTGESWWQAFVCDPKGPIYQQLVAALPQTKQF